MEFNELILKVSSCCNLNCKYCYVFNQGDTSYKTEPATIDKSLIPQIVSRIKEHCIAHKLTKFLVIFHGGEPLMVSKDFYVEFVKEAIELQKNNIRVVFGLQTNGTLLTQAWIDLFMELKISVGISIDGPKAASEYRVYRASGESAYNEIERGINLVKNNGLAINILSVINTKCSPIEVYSYLKRIGVNRADFLFPDITYDDDVNPLITEWLCELFDLWYDDIDKKKTLIRYFDSIVGLFLGVERGYEVLGRKVNKTISLKPNGNIELVDNLKVCGNGFTNTGLNILSDSFDDVSENVVMQKYYASHSDIVLCKKCRTCSIKEICGGGNLAHRYSDSNGFDNPSAYCSTIYNLCSHIQKRLFDDLPEIFNDQNIISLSK